MFIYIKINLYIFPIYIIIKNVSKIVFEEKGTLLPLVSAFTAQVNSAHFIIIFSIY